MRQKWADTGLQVRFGDSGRVPGERGCIVRAAKYQHPGWKTEGVLVVTAPDDDFSRDQHRDRWSCGVKLRC